MQGQGRQQSAPATVGQDDNASKRQTGGIIILTLPLKKLTIFVFYILTFYVTQSSSAMFFLYWVSHDQSHMSHEMIYRSKGGDGLIITKYVSRVKKLLLQ